MKMPATTQSENNPILPAEHHKKDRCWRCLASVLVALLPLVSAVEALAQDNVAAPQSNTATTEAAPAAETVSAAEVDAAAQAFTRKCRGCHTIGGGNLSGPDLAPSRAYPRAQLIDQITRMEKNVGPMSTEEIDALADLLQSPDVNERIVREQERSAKREAATFEPASAATGKALFDGDRPFANRGVACVACHRSGGGVGGTLAVDLGDAFQRLGELPLLSAIENPGFPAMRAAYATQPITKQEAMHLAAFLKEAGAQPVRRAMLPLEIVAIVGAALFFFILGRTHKQRLRGTRARLVRNAYTETLLGDGPGRKR